MSNSVYESTRTLMEKTCYLVMGKTCFSFAILIFFLNSLMPYSAKAITNLTTDQFALLSLKAHITEDPYNILAKNWSIATTTSICNWIGVSCGVGHQRVTALNLSDMGLTGSIAPHLGNLTFLMSLDISNNNFYGFIPQELAHSRRLIDIRLYNNNLTGEVPSWVGTLAELQYLYLSGNNLTGTIPASVCNISKLKTLSLSYNFLHGQIPEHVGNLSSLKLLDLKYNQLTGFIPRVIFNMSSLRSIDLTNNSLSGSLPLEMCNHIPQLEGLYLSVNQLHGQIPSNIYKCRGLRHLSLSYNEFNGSIPREIGNLTILESLYLGYNSLKGAIPREIGNLKRLEVISIQSGSVTGTVPSFIFNMSTLKEIDLGRNNLSGSLPTGIAYALPFLEGLYLNSNHLTGQIPLGLWECRRLQILSLFDNQLIGGISRRVGNLTSLKSFFLNENNLTGTLPKEISNLNLEELNIGDNSLSGLIPPEIFNISTMKKLALNFNHFSGHLQMRTWHSLPNLETLYLGSNELSGMIPVSLSNSSKLTVLDMNQNSFTGFIPNIFGNLRLLRRILLGANRFTRESSTPELSFFSSLTHCRKLDILVLSLNNLSGIIPSSFGNMSTNLRLFEAFSSQIKGDIPIGIGNLSGLRSVSLDSNELTGSIPTTFGELKILEQVYLEHNKLQGSLPNVFCRLKILRDLYLSDNNLTGSIPPCLGELTSLRRLFLDSNKLTSTIPPALWSHGDLLGLNLSSNFLTGNLPSDMGKLKVISQIGLSWNKLSGEIPSSIGGAQTLSYLSLAHNMFEGSIPQSLGNLINLEYLDLSNNKLSGVIPKSLEKLRYINYFNVSFNTLQGEIPNGGEFANFTPESYMGNGALCGAPRLHVQLCKAKRHKLWSKVAPLLKYILPSIAATILIVSLILVLTRRREKISKLVTERDSLHFPWRRVSYQELTEATEAFSENNLLGTGSFGSVYKGTLSDGMTVAVKVFNLISERDFKSFDVECEVMRNIRHRNLVKIMSSCTNLDFKALVLEYMPKGSLETWLHSHNCCLDILQRLNIAIDVASAVEYLHHGSTTPIVHCDLKPNNVLLDEDMVAHVCDFGISKLFGEKEFMAQTKTLGTIGYMAPEYGMEGIVSTSCDVYSYGILLMETFTRKKPTDAIFSGELNLRNWVNAASNGLVIEVVDNNLIGREDENFSAKEECVSAILDLAIKCSTTSPTERINMKEVVRALCKIKLTYEARIQHQSKIKVAK